MALGDGARKLPIAAALGRAVGKDHGDQVVVHLRGRRN
jgi:hypothetical protein